MIRSVVASRDTAAQTFGAPVFVAHTNVALRSFMDEVNRAPAPGDQNDLFTHSDDFEIYHLGSYDDATGRFDLFGDPKLLARAKDLKQS